MNESASPKIEPVVMRPVAEGVAPEVRPGPLHSRGDLEQLGRIEEKTARIEEKFARSEALLLRVQATFEDAMAEFGGLARRTDLGTLEHRLRGLPGVGALLFVGILSAVIGAGLTIASLKYGIPWPLLGNR
jgi:hypothetical protein